MNTTYTEYCDVLKNAAKFWYIIDPRDTTFEFAHQVPDYQQQVWFPFFILIILEHIVLHARKKNPLRLHDQITSLSHWIFHESARVFFRSAEYYVYILIYEKYRYWNLPWDSLWTWCVTAVAVDFCYYWVHRCNHEVHFLWAHHQVHHSSEEFNLAVGLRQSVLQHWCNFAFYLPLAVFIPPSHFIAHHQFNLIYQLWIHTTAIDDLGPFEIVFNTPKHHRVHHGCNLYCLDKNYGGVLIVWDRFFGTFEEEKRDTEIIYGLVVSPQSFNPLYLQVFYTLQLIGKSLSMKNLKDKIDVLWKGPSWFPGGPRLGIDECKINVTSRKKHEANIPTWQNFYIVLHFCMVLYNHTQLYEERQNTKNTIGTTILSNVFGLTTIGLLIEKSRYIDSIELIRCIFCLVFSKGDTPVHVVMNYVYIVSCCVWITQIFRKPSTDRIRAKD